MSSYRESTSRRQEIVSFALSAGSARVDDLAVRFGVTVSTIRRDLAVIAGDGRLVRTFGGAIAPVDPTEQPLRERYGEAYDQKRAIAEWARERVRNGDTILLDGGSTVAALARELRHHERLTVATPSLAVVAELNNAPGVTVLCLGGRLRTLSESFVGPLTEAALVRMTFDSAFLGTDAVDPIRGVCEADLEQTRLKEQMAARADAIYVLADARKIGARPFHAWAQLPKPWTLVTDSGATKERIREFEEGGTTVITVGELPPNAYSR